VGGVYPVAAEIDNLDKPGRRESHDVEEEAAEVLGNLQPLGSALNVLKGLGQRAVRDSVDTRAKVRSANSKQNKQTNKRQSPYLSPFFQRSGLACSLKKKRFHKGDSGSAGINQRKEEEEQQTGWQCQAPELLRLHPPPHRQRASPPSSSPSPSPWAPPPASQTSFPQSSFPLSSC